MNKPISEEIKVLPENSNYCVELWKKYFNKVKKLNPLLIELDLPRDMLQAVIQEISLLIMDDYGLEKISDFYEPYPKIDKGRCATSISYEKRYIDKNNNKYCLKIMQVRNSSFDYDTILIGKPLGIYFTCDKNVRTKECLDISRELTKRIVHLIHGCNSYKYLNKENDTLKKYTKTIFSLKEQDKYLKDYTYKIFEKRLDIMKYTYLGYDIISENEIRIKYGSESSNMGFCQNSFTVKI